ncbi:hypothetical protein Dsin_022671 [Dipteronia sinensis]|uniref:Reverse transcriptase zinc-binding domain-containing protein n=1 Tax=Dipteronia sinensis TaxID=43782 RepID=A0AAE0E058_9ROSI|nr:hypothetical protein Dsin_022671 [Dipteronia sinensis]
MGIYGNTQVDFLEPGISDHSPSVVTVGKLKSFGPRPFKFFSFWAENADFLNWVEEGWRLNVEGVPMFRLYAWLKAVKRILKDKTSVCYGAIHQKVAQAKERLEQAQREILIFLWNGNVEENARAKVSWSVLSMPKKEGGLGIKKLEEWNRAAMMRHIWGLFAKAGSLWVAWVKENLLRGKSFWQVSIPQICTWSWRKLLKLRDEAKHFVSFDVGNGKNIYLWFDACHPDVVLYKKYGCRVIYDAHSKLEAG